MATYGNPNNPRVQSIAGFTASAPQAELADFGVVLNHEHHFELTRLVAKYGDEVTAVVRQALDRYTEGASPASVGTSAEDYVMDRLKRHNWNGHRGKS